MMINKNPDLYNS